MRMKNVLKEHPAIAMITAISKIGSFDASCIPKGLELFPAEE
jgi:hypothetical protein